jgi:hypothetical protein
MSNPGLNRAVVDERGEEIWERLNRGEFQGGQQLHGTKTTREGASIHVLRPCLEKEEESKEVVMMR